MFKTVEFNVQTQSSFCLFVSVTDWNTFQIKLLVRCFCLSATLLLWKSWVCFTWSAALDVSPRQPRFRCSPPHVPSSRRTQTDEQNLVWSRSGLVVVDCRSFWNTEEKPADCSAGRRSSTCVTAFTDGRICFSWGGFVSALQHDVPAFSAAGSELAVGGVGVLTKSWR